MRGFFVRIARSEKGNHQQENHMSIAWENKIVPMGRASAMPFRNDLCFGPGMPCRATGRPDCKAIEISKQKRPDPRTAAFSGSQGPGQ
jgi:hypothetical protein